MTPDQYCQQKASQSGSSFYYSFLFLPPERRRAITAFYAFCREVDDVVDECTDVAVARTKLAWWRTEVAALYAGQAHHPVAQALAPVVTSFRLPQERLQEIIDGMEMDLTQRRYANFDALKLYCHRVAGVVGLLSAEIFGYTDPRTLEYAENLGIYLPLDELTRFNVPVADIMHARATAEFRQLMEFQYERALAYYSAAFAALPAADRKAQRPGLVMAAIYRAVLAEIRADGMPVLTQRTSLTPLRKLWIAWRTWVKS